MANPYGLARVNSMAEVWGIVAELSSVLEGKPVGNAVAATMLLAYLAVSNEQPDVIPPEKAKKLINDVSLFLSMWDVDGRPN